MKKIGDFTILHGVPGKHRKPASETGNWRLVDFHQQKKFPLKPGISSCLKILLSYVFQEYLKRHKEKLMMYWDVLLVLSKWIHYNRYIDRLVSSCKLVKSTNLRSRSFGSLPLPP